MKKPVTRVDGWTVERRAAFLRALGDGASVTGAAALAGMSRESAYRLRRRDPHVAQAWQAVTDGRAVDQADLAAMFEQVLDAAADAEHPGKAAHAHLSRRDFDRWLMRSLRGKRIRAMAPGYGS